MNFSSRIFLILFVILLAGCASVESIPSATATPTLTSTVSSTPTLTTTPKPPTAKPATPTRKPTNTPELVICSLLEGIPVQDLPDTIVNPYAPPRLGSDDPHQGVDFAEVDSTYGIALEGKRVNAVVTGVIAGVINDRFPYGNAVLVETPLERLPAGWRSAIGFPTPVPVQSGHPSLTCPDPVGTFDRNDDSRSIYLMYAHLQEPVDFSINDSVTCGMALGAIGNSGNSLNPHVHLEIRVGPSNMEFNSMAHYTGSASAEEMANYCLWRVSGAFQLLDPLVLFSLDK